MNIPAVLNDRLDFHQSDGVWIRSGEDLPTDFEKRYVALRQKEGRILAIEDIRKLPHFSGANPAEWDVRRESAQRLVNHVKAKKRKLTILELGCGNGWLAALLARQVDSTVTAVDYQITELKQGAIAFSDHVNLQFVYGDILKSLVKEQSFDVIILAAAFQYFPASRALVRKLLSLLTPEGEIHILDSPFYANLQKSGEARNRSVAHFTAMGFPEMADHYFHPLESDLAGFHPHYLNNPGTLLARMKRKLLGKSNSVFPWILIRNQAIALTENPQ